MKIKTAIIGLAVLTMLAGCGQQQSKFDRFGGHNQATSSKSNKNSNSASQTHKRGSKKFGKASADKPRAKATTKFSQASNSTRTSQTSQQPRQSAAPWSSSKASQLASFMASWGTTMKQQYQQYGPGHSVSFYGQNEPDDMSSEPPAVNNQRISIAWSDNGKTSADYALVAVYSDAETQDFGDQHLYFFTLYHGSPVVLVTMQNQGMNDGYLHFDVTQNTTLKNGFAKIVNG
ncbi:DUF4767 domain-containing protein [Lacticaseibacillus pabuli]|uniref:DUF4767 domain-containing protein n=1 Tax=Lacticaseibacillus pabuli TaxID=3025672 RepID=A0ABY7WUE6_9LACO|nr:DUF4767 domain-containing protein [Lacticaseibacillus sp. KACC 23028]WDF83389.1 DUF4767 domain-containing protein [Lacticaseibacillus sp. KACC 23028]